MAGRLLGPRRGALAAGIAIGAYTLLVVEGYTLLRTDRKRWIEMITDGDDVGGGGEEIIYGFLAAG